MRGNRLPAHLGPASPALAPEKDRLRKSGLAILVMRTSLDVSLLPVIRRGGWLFSAGVRRGDWTL